jgi:sugar phosphate isomerase/epimerase
MKLGRDFTNLLYFGYLSKEEQKKLAAGEMTVPDMDATVQVAAKADIVGQVEAAAGYGLDHVELDGAVPNPYLEFTEEQKEEAREAAEDEGITLSLHLPYTYVGASVCAPYEHDRLASVGLHKKYLDFASSIGCKYCIIHPGVVPFYHAAGMYFDMIRSSLVKSMVELGGFASSKGVLLHLENNTAFDGAFFEPEDVWSVVDEVRRQGVELCFNFDIGHWFTRADFGRPVPEPPESVIEKIPSGMFRELHLNDYVPVKKLFHPPLQDELGLLKRDNLIKYAKLIKAKGAELVVVETAVKTKEQLMRSDEIMKGENEFLRKILG